MGIHHRPCRKLASLDLDLPHGRCAALWAATGMASSHQSPVPPCQYPTALSRPSPDDKSTLAERLCGGSLCPSPAPRGIGRLGSRAQGCPFHLLLDADDGHVCLLCCPARAHALPHPTPLLCLRLDGETYARHPSLCPAPSGLLASSALGAEETTSGSPETLIQG